MPLLICFSWKDGYYAGPPPGYGAGLPTTSRSPAAPNCHPLRTLEHDCRLGSPEADLKPQIERPEGAVVSTAGRVVPAGSNIRGVVLSAASRQVPAGGNRTIPETTPRMFISAPASLLRRQLPTPDLQGGKVVTGQHPPRRHAAELRASIPSHLPRFGGKKAVQWAPATKVASTASRGILRRFGHGQVWTVSFSIELTICAQRYTVHCHPLRSQKADIEAFENELVKRVAKGHQETLWAFLDYQTYSLTFQRSGRTSTITIPTDVDSLRDAAFRSFLNAVPDGAKVSLD
jgi:hypothetical protein